MSTRSHLSKMPLPEDNHGSRADADLTRPPRAALLDRDDTLFDHTYSSRAGLLAVCAAHPALGACPFADVLADHAAILEELHLEVLRGAMSIDAARTERFGRLLAHYGAGGDATGAAACYRAAYQAARQPVPGALALLAWLRGRTDRIENSEYRIEKSSSTTSILNSLFSIQSR